MASKRPGSGAAGIAIAFKLIEAVQLIHARDQVAEGAGIDLFALADLRTGLVTGP